MTRPIELFGQTLTIKNEKMHAAFTKVETNMDQIKAIKNSSSEDKSAQLIALYL